MDRASIGPAPPASERASTPPAAARSAWPDACISEPATMANPSEGWARTARPVRAYKDGELTQMCVHLVPAGTQIAKFFRHTHARGSRYSDRPPRFRWVALPVSLEPARPHLTPPEPARRARAPSTACPLAPRFDPENTSCQTVASAVPFRIPLAPRSSEERLRSWPAARPRKLTRVRL